MLNEKKMHANLDFCSALAYDQSEIPINFVPPSVVISRTMGWASHISEQRANNQLIRPSSTYTGPAPRKFVPISQRAKL